MNKRARDYQLTFGSFQTGQYNAITDVSGVRVGHTTLMADTPHIVRTGVTAIIPAKGCLFSHPVRAGTAVINGFGKTAGLVQVQELGRIETPIVLTNTLAVGTAMEAVVRYMVSRNPGIKSLNPVIGECNDSFLNDIGRLSVSTDDVIKAIETAREGPVRTGSTGAGTGTVCFGYKGGIGTSSRIIPIDGQNFSQNFTMGALVQSNFGTMDQLTILGKKIPPVDTACSLLKKACPQGSIMVILGTDIPLSSRQLARVARRAAFGIARTGGTCSHGSGEIAIAFSTANRTADRAAGRTESEAKKDDKTAFTDTRILNENHPALSMIFEAVVDCVEEAVIDSLFTAKTITGVKGRTVHKLPFKIQKD